MSRTRRSTFGSVIAKQTSKGTRYLARYTGPDGRKHSAGTHLTERQAWAALDIEEDDIKRRRWIAPKVRDAKEMAAKVTVGDLVQQRLDADALAGRAPGTLANTEKYAAFLLGDTLADVPIAEMSRADGSAWYLRVQKATGDLNLRRRAYMFLRSVLREAMNNGLTPTIPLYVEGASEKPRKKRAEILTLTPEQLADVVPLIPERYRAWLYVAAYSAVRVGEISGLRADDIGTAEVIHIRRQATRQKGKGIVERDTTKSEASADTALMLDGVAEILADHVAKFSGKGTNPVVFTTRTGGRVESSTIQPYFKKALAVLGLDTRMRVHELRSTGATLLARNGASAATIQRFLRHEHPDMARAYVAKETEHDAARVILSNLFVKPNAAEKSDAPDGVKAASAAPHLRVVA